MPSDLEGVRIRVIGAPVYIDTFSAFGAQPVSMPLGEIYTSLATGAIDAGESDPSGYRVMKFYEQAPMYSLTSHILLIRPLVMNPDALARMTPEQRAEFADVLARVTEDQRTRIMARVDSDIAFLQGQGVTVTPVDLAPFRAAVQPVVEKYSAALGEDLVDAILEAR
jgi:TRAP-type C4-dicarboxylate transport system substrate-binding protein